MNKLDVRYAALSENGESHLYLACNEMATECLDVFPRIWDGTDCHIVVVDPRDTYGNHVCEIARSRNIPVISFICQNLSLMRRAYPPTPYLLNGQSPHADALLKALMRTFRRDSTGLEMDMRSIVPSEENSALVRLSIDPLLKGMDVQASIGNRTVWLLPSSGRVMSSSMSDYLSARDKVASGGWDIRILKRSQQAKPLVDFTASLDAFYMYAAMKCVGSLPPYPYALYRLRDWPDLGAMPGSVQPLKLIQAMQNGPSTPSSMAAQSGLSVETVSACLWALSASGLIEATVNAMPVRSRRIDRVEKSLLQRLALRFGLL